MSQVRSERKTNYLNNDGFVSGCAILPFLKNNKVIRAFIEKLPNAAQKVNFFLIVCICQFVPEPKIHINKRGSERQKFKTAFYPIIKEKSKQTPVK